MSIPTGFEPVRGFHGNDCIHSHTAFCRNFKAEEIWVVMAFVPAAFDAGSTIQGRLEGGILGAWLRMHQN